MTRAPQGLMLHRGTVLDSLGVQHRVKGRVPGVFGVYNVYRMHSTNMLRETSTRPWVRT